MLYFAFAIIIVTTLGILTEYLAFKSKGLSYSRPIPQITPTGSSELASRINELKKRGLPTDILAVKDYDCQHASLETATAWLRVFWYVSSNEFKAHCEGVYPMNFTKEPCEYTQRINQSRLQHALVQRHADLLADLHRLAAVDATTPRYIHDDSRPSRNYFQEMNDLLSLLACEMFVCIDNKQPSRVLASLETQFNLLAIQTSEDCQFKYWYQGFVEVLIVDNLRRALNANVLDQFHLKHLISKMEELPDPSKNWHHIVNCSRAQTLSFMQIDPPLRNFMTGEVNLADIADILSFLECMERYSCVDLSDWKSASLRLEAIQVDLRKNSYADSAIFHLRMVATSIAKTLSSRNQAIIACALQLFRRQNNTYPSQLNSLVDIGIDPAKYPSMAGQPFGYLCQNQTAYLWGPVRDANYEYPLDIMPNIPAYNPDMTAEDRMRIDQALWILES